MSYTKVHTPALIVKSYPNGSADRVFVLFTKELGRVYARATSVREQTAKLRGTLEQFALIDVSLIQTKAGWKITNAQEHRNFFYCHQAQTGKRAVVARVCTLLDRLVQGEEPQEALFATVVAGLDFVRRTTLQKQELDNIEVLLVLRVLQSLGYLGNTHMFEYLLATHHVDDVMLAEVGRTHGRLVREINRSIRALPF